MDLIKNADFIISKEDMGKVCPVFSKSFSAKKEVKKASAQISALGVYEAYINGKRVGDYILAPGWTTYHKRLQYQTYDITDMLQKDNVIEINAGDGWLVENLGHYSMMPWMPQNDRPAVIAAVEIEYTDGEKEAILTDESWKASKSEILKSTIYGGETYDARIRGERNWGDVAVYNDYPKERLIEQEGEIIREIESLDAKELIKTPKGETVIDFGQEVTGYVEFTPRGKSGDTVEIDHGEVLDKDGNFYNANYRSAESHVKYICSGKDEAYKAHHTFYGFRYIKIESDYEIKKEDFKAVVVHSDMKRTGHFECSDEMVNKLYRNIIWGQRGNFLDVPTDCPQRDERLGWTGDANVFFKTAAYNYDVEKFFKKWLRDLRADQLLNGGMPHVVPCVFNYTYTENEKPDDHSSSYWGDAAVVIPWQMYVAYGDKKFLSEQFDSMKKYVEFMRKSGSCECLFDTTWHFSDWLALDDVYKHWCSDEISTKYKQMLAQGAYANSVEILVKAGKALGLDMSEYERLHEGIVKAYNENYVVDGDLLFKTQTQYVIALHFDLVKDKKTYAQRLVKLIKDNGNRLTTGFVGTAYLMDTLTENGYVDVAYSLLMQTEFPSWLFSVRMGATTVWEHWDSLKEDGSMWSTEMNSFNHYAYGAVASWMYSVMAGIDYDEKNPAYKNIIIKPIPDKRIKWVKASLDTRHGTVKSAWKYTEKNIEYNITIPSGATADVTIDGETHRLGAGQYIFEGKLV